MSRNYHKLYVHLILVTKYRDVMITEILEPQLYAFLRNKCEELNLHLYAINGVPDHLHMLIGFQPKTSISTIAKNLKGSSSRFMNEITGNNDLFEWKRGYAVFTVSSQDRKRIIEYIKKQKQHHAKNTIQPENEPN